MIRPTLNGKMLDSILECKLIRSNATTDILRLTFLKRGLTLALEEGSEIQALGKTFTFSRMANNMNEIICYFARGNPKRLDMTLKHAINVGSTWDLRSSLEDITEQMIAPKSVESELNRTMTLKKEKGIKVLVNEIGKALGYTNSPANTDKPDTFAFKFTRGKIERVIELNKNSTSVKPVEHTPPFVFDFYSTEDSYFANGILEGRTVTPLTGLFNDYYQIKGDTKTYRMVEFNANLFFSPKPIADIQFTLKKEDV